MNGFLDCFEIIWETIHEKYFDPTFGGLDWHEVHDRYQPHITAVHDEKTFYAFIPTVHELFRAALTDLRDTQALIIDIRGNHGGVWPIHKKLAENLVNEPALFCSYHSRECIQEIFLKPVENPYSGPLAVLVDVLSMSSAEEFAGAMLTIQRGVVVGERTPGICVVCDFLELPNSALFMFPVKQSVTGKGKALEGHGVIPDIKVALDRTQLL